MTSSPYIDLGICIIILYSVGLAVQNVGEILYWKWADWRLSRKNKNYIQVWETALNTAKRQNVNNKRASIKLVHQTSVMRSNN